MASGVLQELEIINTPYIAMILDLSISCVVFSSESRGRHSTLYDQCGSSWYRICEMKWAKNVRLWPYFCDKHQFGDLLGRSTTSDVETCFQNSSTMHHTDCQCSLYHSFLLWEWSLSKSSTSWLLLSSCRFQWLTLGLKPLNRSNHTLNSKLGSYSGTNEWICTGKLDWFQCS